MEATELPGNLQNPTTTYFEDYIGCFGKFETFQNCSTDLELSRSPRSNDCILQNEFENAHGGYVRGEEASFNQLARGCIEAIFSDRTRYRKPRAPRGVGREGKHALRSLDPGLFTRGHLRV